MMITFTFNGAVNDENVRVYDRLFHGGQTANLIPNTMKTTKCTIQDTEHHPKYQIHYTKFTILFTFR